MKLARAICILLCTVGFVTDASSAGGQDALRPVPTDYSYLPLGARNVWTYACDDGVQTRYCDVRVVGSTPSYAGSVCMVDGYLFGVSAGDPMALCEVDGTLAQYHQGVLHTFYPFRDWDRPFELPALADDCMHGAVGVFEPTESVDVPAGQFTGGVKVRYVEWPCACGGPGYEIFVPGVGLVERTVVSIAGVRKWSLVYAYVNGRTYGTPDHTDVYGATTLRRDFQPVEPATWSRIKGHFR